MKPAKFTWLSSESIEETLSWLAEYEGDCKLFAGGQSLGPLLNMRMSQPEFLVALEHVAVLHEGWAISESSVRIPAMTTYTEAIAGAATVPGLRGLRDGMLNVGHHTIRNAGTVGGSCAHADPSAELPAILVAMGAEFTLTSQETERVVKAADFFDGVFTTVLNDNELIRAIEIPLPPAGLITCWHEIAPQAGAFATVGVAVRCIASAGTISGLRIVLSGVGGKPHVVSSISDGESLDVSELQRGIDDVAAAVAAEIDPRDDTVASAAYRRQLAKLLTGKALRECLDDSLAA